MTLPFTIAQFFDVFPACNAAIWPAQIAADALGQAAVASIWLTAAPPLFIQVVLTLIWLPNRIGHDDAALVSNVAFVSPVRRPFGRTPG